MIISILALLLTILVIVALVVVAIIVFKKYTEFQTTLNEIGSTNKKQDNNTDLVFNTQQEMQKNMSKSFETKDLRTDRLMMGSNDSNDATINYDVDKINFMVKDKYIGAIIKHDGVTACNLNITDRASISNLVVPTAADITTLRGNTSTFAFVDTKTLKAGNVTVAQNAEFQNNVLMNGTTTLKDVVVTGNLNLKKGLEPSVTNNIKLAGNWSGFPDGATNRSEIANDTERFKKLMIVGNKSAGGNRKVGVWDVLDVHGDLLTTGNMGVNGGTTLNNTTVKGNLSTNSFNATGNSTFGSSVTMNGPATMKDVVVTGNLDLKQGLQPSATNNIKISGNWSGFPDGATNRSEIANDTERFKKLMIVGNKSAGGNRKVGVWDALDVYGDLTTTGNMGVVGGTTLSNTTVKGNLTTNSFNATGNSTFGSSVTMNGPATLKDVVVTGNLDLKQGLQPSATNNIKLSGNWSGFPDGATNRSEIANDTGDFKKLMIVGNKSAGGNRKVGVWDHLEVNGDLFTRDNMSVNKTVSVRSGDPGPMIEKNYDSSSPGNRYGMGQFPGGITRTYAAGAYPQASLGMSYAQSDGSFVDVLKISKANPTTYQTDIAKGNLCMGGTCINPKQFAALSKLAGPP
jgi:hypothetical protein